MTDNAAITDADRQAAHELSRVLARLMLEYDGAQNDEVAATNAKAQAMANARLEGANANRLKTVELIEEIKRLAREQGRQTGVDQADDAVCGVDLEGTEGEATRVIKEALAAILALKDKPQKAE